MTDPPEASSSVEQLANAVAAQRSADVILYNGPIQRHTDRSLITACTTRHRHPNVLLILVTMGGDADAAYRMARCLQESYDHFTLYVSGYCKSAGTLAALGANELIMSDHGELGPLDVQLFKKDELWETQSGLTVLDTLYALQDNAFSAFEKFFLNTKARSGGSVTLRTAAKIATEMTTGLFSPLYGQLDPLHIGEAARAMSIAGHYGRRLLTNGQNTSQEALDRILSEYPSHGFVIDRKEALSLFDRVSEPTPNEHALAFALGNVALWPDGIPGDVDAPFVFLSAEPSINTDNTEVSLLGGTHEGTEEDHRSRSGQAAGTESNQLAKSNGNEDTRSNSDPHPKLHRSAAAASE